MERAIPILSPQSQSVIDAFSRQPGVTSEHVGNMRQVLAESPVLAEHFNEAVAQGHLQKIVPLAHAHAGGEYDGRDKAIHLPLAALTSPVVAGRTTNTEQFQAGDLTFVLGHELQHAFNHAARMRAYARFDDDVSRLAGSRSPVHDYTAVIGERLAADRQNEACAQIAGWNAVISAISSRHASPTLERIYDMAPGRMGDFIGHDPVTGYAMKPNLTLNPDLTLSPTPSNLEAMGHNYFDKPPGKSKLGYHGTSDYANLYGASAIGRAVQLERHYNPPGRRAASPRMAVNMDALRLDERLMEDNGIDLGRHVLPMPYYDLGAPSPSLRHFDHTIVTRAHVPIMAGMDAADPSQYAAREDSYNVHSGFMQRTSLDDFLDAYIAAADSSRRTVVYQQYRQSPEMQAMEQEGRELHEAEQQRLRDELRRPEAEPQQRREQEYPQQEMPTPRESRGYSR